MFVIVVPAMIRLMLAPRDDVGTFVFVMFGIGGAAWGFIDQMGRPDGSGLDRGLWISIGVAVTLFIAEVLRWLHRRI